MKIKRALSVTSVTAEHPSVYGDSTWSSERQPIVQTSGFSGDEQIAEDTQSDDEGKKNHSCYREGHESAQTKTKRTKPKQHYSAVTTLYRYTNALKCIRFRAAEGYYGPASVMIFYSILILTYFLVSFRRFGFISYLLLTLLSLLFQVSRLPLPPPSIHYLPRLNVCHLWLVIPSTFLY